MQDYQTGPVLFVAIVLIWPIVLAFMGAYKAFFAKSADE